MCVYNIKEMNRPQLIYSYYNIGCAIIVIASKLSVSSNIERQQINSLCIIFVWLFLVTLAPAADDVDARVTQYTQEDLDN